MQVSGVGQNLVFWDRWLTILVPKKARALTDIQFVEHGLVRHRAPTDCEINRGQRGIMIVTIYLSMQDARIEGKMRERFQMELTEVKSFIPGNGIGLHRLGLN